MVLNLVCKLVNCIVCVLQDAMRKPGDVHQKEIYSHLDSSHDHFPVWIDSTNRLKQMSHERDSRGKLLTERTQVIHTGGHKNVLPKIRRALKRTHLERSNNQGKDVPVNTKSLSYSTPAVTNLAGSRSMLDQRLTVESTPGQHKVSDDFLGDPVYLCSERGHADLVDLLSSIRVNLRSQGQTEYRGDPAGFTTNHAHVRNVKRRLRHRSNLCRQQRDRNLNITKPHSTDTDVTSRSDDTGDLEMTKKLRICSHHQVDLLSDAGIRRLRASMEQQKCWGRAIQKLYDTIIVLRNQEQKNKFISRPHRSRECQFLKTYQQCRLRSEIQEKIITKVSSIEQQTVMTSITTPSSKTKDNVFINEDVHPSPTHPMEFPLWDNEYHQFIFY